MDITWLTPANLTKIIPLLEERQALVKQIEKIDADLTALQNGKTPKAAKPAIEKAPVSVESKTPQKRGRKPKSTQTPSAPAAAKSGPLMDRVIPILKAAGPNGISVPDLAAALGAKSTALHVWFSTTGKKEPSIQKAGRGLYVWKTTSSESPAAEPASEPTAPAEVPVQEFIPQPEPQVEHLHHGGEEHHHAPSHEG